MSPSEHIFQWARNSFPLYERMKALPALKYRTRAVVELVLDTHRDMVECGEIERDTYSAKDALEAAIRMLDWDGEE